MPINWLSLTQAKLQLSRDSYTQLADNGSLTRRVRSACPGVFEVQLIKHHTVRLAAAERALLSLEDDSMAISRQVFLSCDQHPLIFARTLIALSENNRALIDRISKLGEHSLGSILFKDPLAKKLDMHLAEIPGQHVFFEDARLPVQQKGESFWVRRSLYCYEGSELIVYEAFISWF